ncbi:hypothetical protein SAMN04487781_3122 [Cellulosimicrobium cellulans]|nr:hypothetical protein SAMN04487781_3122 [Cellulosimicrobium cellulans]
MAAAVVAALALIVAWLARRDSRRSADASDRSADASDRSARAAERAAEITELEARRRVERSDVAWQRVTDIESGLVRYQNIGSHDAFDVTVVLTINDERTTLNPGQVSPGGHFEHDARTTYGAENQAALEEMRSSPPGIFIITTTRFSASARISWESELGSPGIVTL